MDPLPEASPPPQLLTLRARQVHNHIKIVNDLAKKVKEEIQSLVGMNADLKWEKAKAEVTAKAYCTELLTTKKVAP
jgi:hypothetical protein